MKNYKRKKVYKFLAQNVEKKEQLFPGAHVPLSKGRFIKQREITPFSTQIVYLIEEECYLESFDP